MNEERRRLLQKIGELSSQDENITKREEKIKQMQALEKALMLDESIETHADYIAEETLATEIWLNGRRIYPRLNSTEGTNNR